LNYLSGGQEINILQLKNDFSFRLARYLHAISARRFLRVLRGAMIVTLLFYTLNLTVPSPVFGVSFVPAPLYHRHERVETTMKTGEPVYLFHSSTVDVKRSVHVSDILTVYRIDPSCEVKTVGKIKVISYVGDTYIEGVVVEGEIKANDVAKKGAISCLVILKGICLP